MIDMGGRWRPALAVLSAAALLMTGCAKSEDDPAAKATADSSAAVQTTKSAAAGGSTCTLQQFGGTKVDLKTATIGFSQFSREEGQKVSEQLLQSKPNINGIYAENDEMALGAITALKGASKKAGDVKIVTIDGTKGAVQGIVDGWIFSVIESNPRFGPLAFGTATKFFNGEAIAENIIISDREYDSANAAADLGLAY